MSNSAAAGPSPSHSAPLCELTAAEYERLSVADTVRYRSAFARPSDPTTGRPAVAGDDFVAEHRRLTRELQQQQGGADGAPNPLLPALLSRLDMIFFILMFVGFGLLLKYQYKIDVVPHVWRFVKPSYDEGVEDYWSWDGESSQRGDEAGGGAAAYAGDL